MHYSRGWQQLSAALLASTAENMGHWIQCLKGTRAALKDWKEEIKQVIYMYDIYI